MQGWNSEGSSPLFLITKNPSPDGEGGPDNREEIGF